MLGKKLFIVVSVMTWITISSETAYAQLLEDRNKLKTVKRKRAFILFKKKVKSSQPSRSHKTKYIKTPSSAKRTAGQNSDRIVNPRFSTPHAYHKSPHSSNRKKGFLSFLNMYTHPPKHKPNPKLQRTGTIKIKTPKHFDVGDHNQNFTRYSRYIATWHGKSPKAKKAHDVDRIKNRKKGRNMHPSAYSLSAKNNSPIIRDAKRKFDIIWMQMIGNKMQPKAVRQKIKKSKFDKNEKDIWNN